MINDASPLLFLAVCFSKKDYVFRRFQHIIILAVGGGNEYCSRHLITSLAVLFVHIIIMGKTA